ncbi:MAG: hypothetical protein RMJ17_00790, partial [Candidatus Aenigmarchaeota archaeon]|nr:hypothetical protein [Candidatus Aenigmarchaeota archaeon]MDW8149122.1 hypothetical protein [Candidatus Aenigmarchaeota archaeon]
TNIRVMYDERKNLDEIIEKEEKILVLSYYPYTEMEYIKNREVVICDVSDFIIPYLRQDNGNKPRKRIINRNISYIKGDLNSIRDNSFDWIIFDLHYILPILELATDEKLYKIFIKAAKRGRNLAYIFPVDSDYNDVIFYVFTVAKKLVASFIQVFSNVLSKPIEIQMNKEKIKGIIISLRIAGYREINVLNFPLVSSDPYQSLARSLFIYGLKI